MEIDWSTPAFLLVLQLVLLAFNLSLAICHPVFEYEGCAGIPLLPSLDLYVLSLADFFQAQILLPSSDLYLLSMANFFQPQIFFFWAQLSTLSLSSYRALANPSLLFILSLHQALLTLFFSLSYRALANLPFVNFFFHWCRVWWVWWNFG